MGKTEEIQIAEPGNETETANAGIAFAGVDEPKRRLFGLNQNAADAIATVIQFGQVQNE